VTVFVSGLVIFFAKATTLLLVLSINSKAVHLVSSSTPLHLETYKKYDNCFDQLNLLTKVEEIHHTGHNLVLREELKNVAQYACIPIPR